MLLPLHGKLFFHSTFKENYVFSFWQLYYKLSRCDFFLFICLGTYWSYWMYALMFLMEPGTFPGINQVSFLLSLSSFPALIFKFVCSFTVLTHINLFSKKKKNSQRQHTRQIDKHRVHESRYEKRNQINWEKVKSDQIFESAREAYN